LHPITVIEIVTSVGFVLVIFVIVLVSPTRIRKLGLIVASILTLLLLLSFAIRPVWIEFQVSKKTEQLNQYLEKKYPYQEWEISRPEGRQYNPYHLTVRFKNEAGWAYTYLVADNNIHQIVWIPPEGKSPEEGTHSEMNH